MQILVLASLSLLTIAAVIFLIPAFFDPRSVSGSTLRALRVLAVGSLIVSLSIVALLAIAQPQVCDVLDGTWIRENESCRHEWGGNGINDVSDFSWGRFWDPVQPEDGYRPAPGPPA